MGSKKSMQSTLKASTDKTQYLETEYIDNPVLIRDEQSEAALVAYKKILAAIHQLEDNISDEERKFLIDKLQEVYLERKAASYIKVRLNSIACALENVIYTAIKHDKDEDDTRLYYYNSIRHCIKNEW